MDQCGQIEKEALQLFDCVRNAEKLSTDQLEDGKQYIIFSEGNPLENIAVLTYNEEIR